MKPKLMPVREVVLSDVVKTKRGFVSRDLFALMKILGVIP